MACLTLDKADEALQGRLQESLSDDYVAETFVKILRNDHEVIVHKQSQVSKNRQVNIASPLPFALLSTGGRVLDSLVHGVPNLGFRLLKPAGG
jgi:hypothetical protein